MIDQCLGDKILTTILIFLQIFTKIRKKFSGFPQKLLRELKSAIQIQIFCCILKRTNSSLLLPFTKICNQFLQR